MRLYRHYSVQAVEAEPQCEIQYLSLSDLKSMRIDFPEVFNDIFVNGRFELNATERAKQHSLELLETLDPPLKAIGMVSENRRNSQKFKLS